MCTETACGPSFAPRTKPSATSAMSCVHNNRLDWVSVGVPYFTRTTGGSRQVKRAIRSRGGGLCLQRHLYHQWNEEGRRRSRAKSDDRRPQRAAAADSSGSQDAQSKELQNVASGRRRGGPIDQRSDGKPSHLQQDNVHNTMRVSARVRPRARSSKPDRGQGSTLAWDHALTQRRGSLDRQAKRCGTRSMVPDHHAHLQLKERLSSYEAFCCPLGRPALASQEELTK